MRPIVAQQREEHERRQKRIPRKHRGHPRHLHAQFSHVLVADQQLKTDFWIHCGRRYRREPLTRQSRFRERQAAPLRSNQFGPPRR
jgi:hypothetical protein